MVEAFGGVVDYPVRLLCAFLYLTGESETVDAADAALDGDGRSGQAGDQAVAFGGGYAEQRGAHAVYDDGEQRRA